MNILCGCIPVGGDPRQAPQDSYQHRNMADPRSKSTSNLHVDTTFEGDAAMRPAQSVGMLHPSHHSPGGRRPDPR